MKRIMFVNGSIAPMYFGYPCAPAYVYPTAPTTSLTYQLKKAENSLVLRVNEQSEDITSFLKSNHYRASNGLLISSDQYPEFKDSTNTIYLRGSNFFKNDKLDVTRFVGNMQRDRKAAMVEKALAEFVGYVKSLKPYWSVLG